MRIRACFSVGAALHPWRKAKQLFCVRYQNSPHRSHRHKHHDSPWSEHVPEDFIFSNLRPLAIILPFDLAMHAVDRPGVTHVCFSKAGGESSTRNGWLIMHSKSVESKAGCLLKINILVLYGAWTLTRRREFDGGSQTFARWIADTCSAYLGMTSLEPEHKLDAGQRVHPWHATPSRTASVLYLCSYANLVSYRMICIVRNCLHMHRLLRLQLAYLNVVPCSKAILMRHFYLTTFQHLDRLGAT